MIVELICGVVLFATGTAVGRTLERLDLAARNRSAASDKLAELDDQKTGLSWVSDTNGDFRFKGIITASDFLDAMNSMPLAERRFVAQHHKEPLPVVQSIFYLFHKLTLRDKALA